MDSEKVSQGKQKHTHTHIYIYIGYITKELV